MPKRLASSWGSLLISAACMSPVSSTTPCAGRAGAYQLEQPLSLLWVFLPGIVVLFFPQDLRAGDDQLQIYLFIHQVFFEPLPLLR